MYTRIDIYTYIYAYTHTSNTYDVMTHRHTSNCRSLLQNIVSLMSRRHASPDIPDITPNGTPRRLLNIIGLFCRI